MTKDTRAQMIAVLVIGGLLGYAAASTRSDLFRSANASPSSHFASDKPAALKPQPTTAPQGATTTAVRQSCSLKGACCANGSAKSQLMAMANYKAAAAAANLQAEGKKPNILFIMGDDIGWMQPGCYHRGLMVGETPNIDRIATEGAIFMDYVAMQSCTSGRNAFVTGMYPLRTGMIPPQLPGSPSYLRPGTPCIAKFLLDLGYTTGQFGKNHLGDHPDALPTAHGFQEYWGYLYHLDAMQQVSFPDINKTPTEQGIVPPMKVEPIPGIPEPPGAIDPEGRRVHGRSASDPVDEVAGRHGEEPDGQGRRSAHSGAVEDGGRGNLRPRHRLARPQRPQEDRQAVLLLLQPGAHARHDRAVAEV